MKQETKLFCKHEHKNKIEFFINNKLKFQPRS